MEDEPKLIHSPLEREVSQGGVSVRIFIYRAEDETTWLLEIEDHLRGSTVNDNSASGVIRRRSRLGGLLNFYHREAA